MGAGDIDAEVVYRKYGPMVLRRCRRLLRDEERPTFLETAVRRPGRGRGRRRTGGDVTKDELDRILSSTDLVEPSSGFTNAVMDGVRERAAEAHTLPFPWGRFAAGLAACGLLAASTTVLLLRVESSLAPIVAPLAAAAPELGYAALALLVSLITARLPRAFARR